MKTDKQKILKNKLQNSLEAYMKKSERLTFSDNIKRGIANKKLSTLNKVAL